MAELELPQPGMQQPVPEETVDSSASHRETLISLLVFLGQRLLYAAVVLLFIIFLSYFGIGMAGGADFETAVSEAVVETLHYVERLLHGSMGLTTAGSNTLIPIPVTDVIKERLPRSLALLGLALLFSALVGVFMGMRAARSRSESSIFILIATIIGISVPSFFAAFLLQWGITSLTRIRGQAILPVGGFGWDNHLILPVLVLSARPIAQITRMTFVTLRQVLRQDYVRTARAKGLRKFQVTWRHIMRNAAIPILTTLGMSLRFSLSSLPVVELYFGIPGVGSTLLKGIAQQDANLTVGLTLCFGAIFILVNMILELSYRLIDPRLWDAPSFVSANEHHSRKQVWKAWRDDVGDLLTNNAIVNQFKRRNETAVASPFAAILKQDEQFTDEDLSAHTGTSLAWRRVLSNRPFILGSLLVIGLIVIILFGPAMSPNNPFKTIGLQMVDGQLTTPPFAPNAEFPWGSDALGRGMMSLVLSGAQMTLTVAIMAVAARVVIGVLLGAIAGWRSGSWIDRAIVGLSEVIAAFPTLILAMILILAIGIRQGMSTFVIALCFVGWGEIMQYVRSEVISIRPKEYIESAVAMGARTPRIIGRHVLPQLFSALISLVALEVGSVLMLLGELGFISIFVGGGAYIELPGISAALYSDIPEWGALLSNVRYLARTYPWTALYPMLAFFVAILAFNLFGEGVRRLVDSGSLVINRIFNKYTVLGTLGLIMGIFWLQNNSGTTPFLRDYAQGFDGQQALAYVEELTTDAMNGRSLGTPGQAEASQYVAEQFAALGLQPAGEAGTFFQERSHGFERLTATPELTIADNGTALVYGTDFAAYPGRNMTAGEADGEVVFVGLGRPIGSRPGSFRASYPELDRADLSDNILLVLSDWEVGILDRTEKDGLLVVTDDPEKLKNAYTLSGRSGQQLNMFTGARTGEEIPALWISEETADRLLADSGQTVADLRRQTTELGLENVLQIPIAADVSMNVQGEIEEYWKVNHVIGFWPGSEGFEGCADCMDRELIVVMAQMDSPPPGPTGKAYAAANDNASGVGVMLEVIRVMQESGYEPKRSIMFVAYNGEGLDGGEPVTNPDIRRFLQAKTGFASAYIPEAIVQLRGLGTSDGNRLEVSAAGSLRLAELFEKSAQRMGVDTVRAREIIDIDTVYDDGGGNNQGGQEAPVMRLTWEGWEETSRTAADTFENISSDNLEKAGRALSLALMTMGFDRDY